MGHIHSILGTVCPLPLEGGPVPYYELQQRSLMSPFMALPCLGGLGAVQANLNEAVCHGLVVPSREECLGHSGIEASTEQTLVWGMVLGFQAP